MAHTLIYRITDLLIVGQVWAPMTVEQEIANLVVSELGGPPEIYKHVDVGDIPIGMKPFINANLTVGFEPSKPPNARLTLLEGKWDADTITFDEFRELVKLRG